MRRRGLSIIYSVFVLNLLLLVAVTYVRSLQPITNVRLTTQADGIIVFGQNRLGLSSVRTFRDWPAAADYLAERGLHTPVVDFVEPIHNAEVALKRSGSHSYYRIFWGSPTDGVVRTAQLGSGVASIAGRRQVLHAPDAESALVMYQLISHSKYVAGKFGFSVVLEN